MSKEITSDSISLGWKADEHERMLLLIQDGQVIHYAIQKDSQLGHGRGVIAHDIIDWAKKTIELNEYDGEYVWKQGHGL